MSTEIPEATRDAARVGERWARDEILSITAPWVAFWVRRYHRVCRRLVGNVYDDLVIEAQLAVLRAIKDWSVDGGASFSSFITLYIRNALSQELQRHRRTVARHVKYVNESFAEPNEDVEEQLGELQFVTAFERAIDTLPARLSFVMRKRYRGENLRDIAPEMNVSHEMVRLYELKAMPLLRRACERLIQEAAL